MGRAPCCDKANVKKGPWAPEEDSKLKKYIETNGTGGNWITLPTKAGLKRCGKSCRLRWINYLRPDIKHGSFTEAEEKIIYEKHAKIGSRWSVIATLLPGRTDNDIKNYWNTRLKKKLAESGSYPQMQCMQRNFTMSMPSQLPALTTYPSDGDMLHAMNAQQQQQQQSQMLYPFGQYQLPYNADVGPSHASPLNISHVNQAYAGAIRQHQYIQHAAQQQLINQFRADQQELQQRKTEEWEGPELLFQGQPSQEVVPTQQEIMNFGEDGSKFKELYSSLASCLGSGGAPAVAENGMEAKYNSRIVPVNAAAEGSDVFAGSLQPTDMTNIPGCHNMGMSRLSGAPPLVPIQTPPPMELSRHHSPTSSCSASESFSACNNYHDEPTNLGAEDPQSIMDSPDGLPSTPMPSYAQCTIGDLDDFSSIFDWQQGIAVKEEPTELSADSYQLKPPSTQSSLPPRREPQWSPRCGAMNMFGSPLRAQTASTQGLDSDPFKSNFIAT